MLCTLKVLSISCCGCTDEGISCIIGMKGGLTEKEKFKYIF